MRVPYILKGILQFLGCFLFVSIGGGLTFMLLWNWFIAPVFSGMPELKLVQAIGVSIVVGFFTSRDRSEKETYGEIVSFALCLYAFSLGFGWLIHHFFMQ